MLISKSFLYHYLLTELNSTALPFMNHPDVIMFRSAERVMPANKKRRQFSLPPLQMFSQRNNPYCDLLQIVPLN